MLLYVFQVARTSPVNSANGYVSHPYVWKDSSTAAPSSSSSSAASSASGSPTLPPAAPNGYTKVGCVEPKAPVAPTPTPPVVVAGPTPPTTASSGYVALGNGGVPIIRRAAPPATSNYVPHPPAQRLEAPSAEHEQSHWLSAQGHDLPMLLPPSQDSTFSR